MAHLSILVAEFGEDIPYVGGLARRFPFRGTRMPFINYQKGIYRAAIQAGPAALSIQTSAKSPYDDEILADGFLYAYRTGSIDRPITALCVQLTTSRCHLSTSLGRDRDGTSQSFHAS